MHTNGFANGTAFKQVCFIRNNETISLLMQFVQLAIPIKIETPTFDTTSLKAVMNIKKHILSLWFATLIYCFLFRSTLVLYIFLVTCKKISAVLFPTVQICLILFLLPLMSLLQLPGPAVSLGPILNFSKFHIRRLIIRSYLVRWRNMLTWHNNMCLNICKLAATVNNNFF